jgi:UDP-N-acetylmuramoyl-tripeptide--D-alanyl-D-alanine ligase
MLPLLITYISRLFVLLALGPAAGSSDMQRVTLAELEAATGGRAIACNPADVAFEHVTVDSRTAVPGDLFWALKGERHDGHDFVVEAVGRGAVACVIEQTNVDAGRFRPNSTPAKPIAGKIPAVVVPDVLQGLQDFARSHRQRMDALVIGVTGSVGKTTTREMLHAALSSTLDGCRSPRNFNNHIGVPLSLLEIDRHHAFAVLELAASRQGEIRELAQIALPQIGVLTNIGVAHLAGFGTVEAIGATKAELLQSLPNDGLAVVNGDDFRCRAASVKAPCRVVTFGEGAENDIRATAVACDGHGLTFRVDSTTYRIPAVGRHHLVAGLAAIAVGRELGMKPSRIADGLARVVPVAGRCQVRQRHPWTLIDDTYNANPTSVEAACRLLSEWSGDGRRILVLADMLQLGPEAAQWHAAIGQCAARLAVDRLIAVGQHAADCVRGARAAGMPDKQLTQCNDVQEAAAALKRWLEPGDVVLVKGSRSMRMERVVDELIASTNEEENIAPCASTRACALF